MKVQKVCSNCGYTGKPKRHTKGSTFIELVLWCCFIVPGLIYSGWRLSSRQEICPKCKTPNMLDTDTPVGKKLVKQFSEE